MSGGVLYFVQVEGGGPIKAGFTCDPDLRLRTLQGWCPYKLEPLLCLKVEDKIAETYALEILRPYKVRGEWFEPHPFVLNFIDAIRRSGRIEGCPDAVPYTSKKATIEYSRLIPAVWATWEELSADTGINSPNVTWNVSDGQVCRIIIAARRRGFNFATADLLEFVPRINRPYKKPCVQSAGRKRGRKPVETRPLLETHGPMKKAS